MSKRAESKPNKVPRAPEAASQASAPDDAASTSTPVSTASPDSSPKSGMGSAVAFALGLAALLFLVNRAVSSTDTSSVEPGDPIDLSDERPSPDPTPDPVPPAGEPEALVVRVIRSFPHDPRSFTQGLEYHDGVLYEGTGIRRRSTMRRVALETGEVLLSADLPPEVFGEGIAMVGERVFQLSWVEGRAFLRNRADFTVEREFSYEGEGWGLCYDGTRLVMSDGSDHLFFRDPETFEVTGSIAVTLRGEPLDQLNELECVLGVVYANVWQTDHIARIDPITGVVTGWIDTTLHRGSPPGARMLEPDEAEYADVLNGIAWMPDRGHFVIGGKEWPRIFEVEFVPAPAE